MYVRRSICKPVCEDLSSRVSSHILVLSRSRGMRVFARSYCRTSRNVSAVSHSISLHNDLVSLRLVNRNRHDAAASATLRPSCAIPRDIGIAVYSQYGSGAQRSVHGGRTVSCSV